MADDKTMSEVISLVKDKKFEDARAILKSFGDKEISYHIKSLNHSNPFETKFPATVLNEYIALIQEEYGKLTKKCKVKIEKVKDIDNQIECLKNGYKQVENDFHNIKKYNRSEYEGLFDDTCSKDSGMNYCSPFGAIPVNYFGYQKPSYEAGISGFLNYYSQKEIFVLNEQKTILEQKISSKKIENENREKENYKKHLKTPKGANEEACEWYKQLTQWQEGMEYQKRIEQEGGIIDKVKRRKLATGIVWRKDMLKQWQNNYKNASGKEWSSSNCK